MMKPERIVLISGIPLPAAIYMVLVAPVGADDDEFSFPSVAGSTVVKFVLVVIVTLEARTPNMKERATYMP